MRALVTVQTRLDYKAETGERVKPRSLSYVGLRCRQGLRKLTGDLRAPCSVQVLVGIVSPREGLGLDSVNKTQK